MPSTVIRRFSYDPRQRRLRIWFVSGSVYDYFDVPAEVNEAFRAAFSKGTFFADHIRPVFEYEKVEDPRDDDWRPAALR